MHSPLDGFATPDSCFVQQAAETSSAEDKIRLFSSNFDSPSISLRKHVKLTLLPESQREVFLEHVGRLYGESSNYVHLTAKQLQQRLKLIKSGRKPGLESPEEVAALNQQIQSNLAAAFVFVAHAVPSSVVGDLFVSANGSSHEWTLAASKFVAYLDEYFDYKHERKSVLAEIQAARWRRAVAA